MRKLLLLLLLCCQLITRAQYGTIDPTFNPGDVGRGYGDGVLFAGGYVSGIVFGYIVTSAVVLPDGKILCAGQCTYYNNAVVNSVFRLKADGTLDSTFSVGAGPVYDVNISAPKGAVSGLSLQTDGKILAVGSFVTFNGVARKNIVRLNPDGSVDNAFYPTLPADVSADYMFQVPSGKILIGGHRNNYNNFIGRFNQDGSPDNSFQLATSLNFIGSSAILQPDGKILIDASSTPNGFGITRLLPDGAVDPSFIAAPEPFSMSFPAKALQADGKILYLADTVDASTSYAGRWLKRRNADGSVDNSFVKTLLRDGGGNNTQILPLANGKIVVGGAFLKWNNVDVLNSVRLFSDGTLDNSYQPDIVYGHVIPITVQPDGKIIAGGNFQDEASRNYLRRLTVDGKTDPTFNAGTGVNGTVYCIAAQADGKRLVCGAITGYNGTLSGSLARIQPDGSRDASLQIPLTKYRSIFAALAQADGRIIVGGYFKTPEPNSVDTLRPNLVRLFADGSPDNSFALDPKIDGEILALALQPDGKLLVGGYYNHYLSGISKGIVRLNSDGTPDPTFHSGTGAFFVESIIVQPDGKILISGGFSSYDGSTQNNIARLNADGTIDPSFQTGTGFNGEVWMIKRQADGKIVACGDFTSYNGNAAARIARINSNGSFDAGFATGSGANSTVQCIDVRSDGKIAAGGNFTTFNTVSAKRLVLLDADGTVNTSFPTSNGATNTVAAVRFETDGNLLAAGYFTGYGGTYRNRIVRLLTPPSVTAVSNLQNAGTISLSPIPARDYLLVEAGRRGKQMNLRLIDAAGRVVLDLGTFTNSTRISLSSLPAGEYYIELTDRQTKEKSIRSFLH